MGLVELEEKEDKIVWKATKNEVVFEALPQSEVLSYEATWGSANRTEVDGLCLGFVF